MTVLAGIEPMTAKDCFSCPPSGTGPDRVAACPASENACGHHCNHSWTHERCCWCGRDWSEQDA